MAEEKMKQAAQEEELRKDAEAQADADAGEKADPEEKADAGEKTKSGSASSGGKAGGSAKDAESAEDAKDAKDADGAADAEGAKDAEGAESAKDAEGAEDAKDAEGAAEEKKDEENGESADERYVRLMADFQNYKRRVEKEKADVYSFANEKLMTELLGVLDNFERAVDQACADEAYQKGVEMTFRQFREVLEKEGLSEIEAQGEDFDPTLHHAVLTDDNDEFESGQITAVLQKGYKLNDKVIRPAMVKVNN